MPKIEVLTVVVAAQMLMGSFYYRVLLCFADGFDVVLQRLLVGDREYSEVEGYYVEQAEELELVPYLSTSAHGSDMV